ncbi:fibronectin type III domain-containing protein [Paenibacillus sp. SI8]|uniref:RCC1 domain-containing protein n=1 Tax=unclassified Paenibacillus TaxID=185978 RepID=UPI003465ADE0
MNLKRKSSLLVCSFLVAAQTFGFGGAAQAESVGTINANEVLTEINGLAPRSVSVTDATYSVLDTAAPSIPTNLVSTAKTAVSVSFSWNASTDNVGVKGYEIYSNGVKVSTSISPTYTATNLTPNTNYNFTVKALDAAGNASAESQTLSITTSPVVALAGNETLYEIENLVQTNSGDTFGAVSDAVASGGKWALYNSNAVGDFVEYEINVPETGNYNLKLLYKSGNNRGIAQVSLNGTSLGSPFDFYNNNVYYLEKDFGIVNLNAGVKNKIKFLVTGKNALGTGYIITLDAIKLTKQTATDTIAPTAPTSLTAPTKTDTSISLSWTASTDNIGVTGYDVYNGTALVGTTTGTTYNATGLQPATAYTFTVKAKDAAGNVSAASNAVSATTNPAATDQYLFEIESLPQADSGDTSTITPDAAASAGQWENYQANAINDYTEYAVNVPKAGAYEVIVKAKKGTTGGTAQLSFDGTNLGSGIDFYKSAAAFEDISKGMISFSSAGFKIVRFTVTGKNAASTGYSLPLDAIKLVGTTDTAAPTAPTDLIMTAKSSSTVSLSWTPSTDNVGVTNYEVYNSNVRIAISPVAVGAQYIVNGLSPNTSYTFTVKAVDGAGNTSAASNPVTVTTSSPLPLSPLPVTLGSSHNLYIKGDGTVWSWGYNGYGGLGNSTTNNSSVPSQVINLANMKAIAGGKYHTLAVRNDGSLFAWGYNGYGQLGDASTTQRTSPIQVTSQTLFTAVAAGENHSLALKTDATVWAFGYNYDGQLGDGTTTNQKTPVQVKDLTSVSAIAAGRSFSLALKSDGTVWSWGSNSYGELGTGLTAKSSVPVQVAFLTNVKAIAAGDFHGVALKQDGTVWAWGYNTSGQLGNNSTINQLSPVQIKDFTSVKSIAAGSYHTLAIKQDGTAWAWGYNGYGQLGLGSTTERSYPALIPNLTSVSSLAGGENQTLALGNDGILYSWGRNNYGQLGNGTTNDSLSPQKVIGPNINPADVTAPAAITDFRLVTQNVRSMRLDWTKTTDDVGVSSYEIYNGNILLGTTAPSSTSYTINNLALNTTYAFNIKSKDATGNRSQISNIVQVTSTDKTPPTTPKDLTLLGVTSNTATLTWTASTDNDLVKQYNIYLGATKVGNTGSNSYTLTGLSPKTAYAITVKAEDDAGNESLASPALSVTTELP